MTPRLLSDMVFEGGEAASAVVAAWRFLADAETGVRTDYTKAPVGVVSRAWKPSRSPGDRSCRPSGVHLLRARGDARPSATP